MMINTTYEMHQEVGIIDKKNYPGRIYQIRMEGSNLYYDVEYWDGMDRKTASFYEHELSNDLNEVQ